MSPGDNPTAVNKYYYVARARKRTYELQSHDIRGSNYCHDLGVEDTTSKWGKPGERSGLQSLATGMILRLNTPLCF